MVKWTLLNLPLCLIVVLQCMFSEAKSSRRHQRNIILGKIAIIRNETFLCHSLMKKGMRKIKLSGHSKMKIFQEDGGIYVPGYMARNAEEAKNNFRNMLGYMAPPPSQENPASFHRIEDNWKSLPKVQQRLGDFFRTLPRGHYSMSTPSVTNAVSQPSSHARHRGNREHHPVSHRNRRRRKRAAPTTESEQIDYCLARGAVERGHKRMCQTCAATRVLTRDSYPRMFNEAICHQDTGCFYVQNVPHGQCRQNYMHVNILQRTEGMCSLALKDGSHVIVDDWQLQTLSLRTGCECFIDVDSMFAPFV